MNAGIHTRLPAELWEAEDPFTIEDARQLLCSRFDEIDYSQAKEDVRPFIKDTASLDLWSADFFKQITEGLRDQH